MSPIGHMGKMIKGPAIPCQMCHVYRQIIENRQKYSHNESMNCRKLIMCIMAFSFLLQTNAQDVEDLGLSPEQLEDRLIELVNRERSGKGQTVLTVDKGLREVSRAHSRKMADEDKLGHHFSNYPELDQRAAASGIFFSELGENVAAGETFVMRFVHEALMDSPEHRKNILSSKFSHLGIGIIKKGNIYYTTQTFAQLMQARTAAEIEQLLKQEITARIPDDQLAPMMDNPDLKTLCRERATGFMNGKTSAGLSENWPWGKAELVSHTYTQPQEVIEKLLPELTRPLQGWILGAAFGRTPKNPGGICSVTLITFPKLVSGDNPEKYLFDQLNQYRLNQGKRLASWSEPMAKVAGRIARSFNNESSGSHWPPNCRLCFVYETFDLTIMPDPLLDLMKNKNIKSMGVHILPPPAHSSHKNALIIAVIGN